MNKGKEVELDMRPGSPRWHRIRMENEINELKVIVDMLHNRLLKLEKDAN